MPLSQKIIEDLWFKDRSLVSDGFDESLDYLSGIADLTVHEIPSGTRCWTWKVPEKWVVHEAWLADGEKKICDYADHPLHLLNYSLPFDGEVTREELLRHVYVSEKHPEAIPFKFKYYERDWGFCLPKHVVDGLTAERYRVKIDTDFSPGTLKVGEVTVRGKSDDTVILMGHLDHPAQVNDGLSGVAVGIDILREVATWERPWFTTTLLIFPETIGSIAFLSQNEERMKTFRAGAFLEMLGVDQPLVLQHSPWPLSRFDRVAEKVFRQRYPDGQVGPYKSVVVNDDKITNWKGIDIPSIGISRAKGMGDIHDTMPGYHTSLDNLDACDASKLDASRDLMLDILKTLARDYRPVPKFRGPVFLSGYGLFVDWQTNPEINLAQEAIMERFDGKASLFDIAEELDLDFDKVRWFADRFKEKDLIEVETPEW